MFTQRQALGLIAAAMLGLACAAPVSAGKVIPVDKTTYVLLVKVAGKEHAVDVKEISGVKLIGQKKEPALDDLFSKPGKLTLTHVSGKNDPMKKWYESAEGDEKKGRKDAVLLFKNGVGETIKRFRLEKAWPSKYEELSEKKNLRATTVHYEQLVPEKMAKPVY
jgi:hypothetical protein